jgi:hypothetical protein
MHRPFVTAILACTPAHPGLLLHLLRPARS